MFSCGTSFGHPMADINRLANVGPAADICPLSVDQQICASKRYLPFAYAGAVSRFN